MVLSSGAPQPVWLPGAISGIGANGTNDPEKYDVDLDLLFSTDHFEAIDKAAEGLRVSKERFAGGGWKLHTLYMYVGQPATGQDSPEELWKTYFARMNRWLEKYPDSVAAHVALAKAYSTYAWKARGVGMSDSVTQDGWRLFGERIGQAKATLMAVAKTKPLDPEWYAVMQEVGIAEGWSKDDAAKLFQAAVSVEPLYYYFYQNQARYLSTKWYGDEGESARFIESAADKIGGKAGDFIYADAAASLMCNCESDFMELSWPRAKSGFEYLQQTYGMSPWRENQLALLAFRAADEPVAAEAFAHIGDKWDPSVWQWELLFTEAKQWATNTKAPDAEVRTARAAVEANMNTSAGQQFDAVVAQAFPAQYEDAVKTCVTRSAAKPASFDLLVQVGGNGFIQRMYAVPETQVAHCMYPKLAARKLAAPPQPKYWIRIAMAFEP